ncbi:hypothetical protein N0V88_001970 [Collariella sp. IMI 366227]|nr:hypothetical protein N0V88_001970 [Collariella sp. IMI 366227]
MRTLMLGIKIQGPITQNETSFDLYKMEGVPDLPVSAPTLAQDAPPPVDERDLSQSDEAEIDDLDFDQADAQSTPAAEKAAVFERQPGGGLFDMSEIDEPSPAKQTQTDGPVQEDTPETLGTSLEYAPPVISQPRNLSPSSQIPPDLVPSATLHDERFVHVREQVNVRFKAIKDSFDSPSFKLPQMPKPMPGVQRSSSVRNGQQAAQDPLDAVLETLTGDIVIMGGYRGSILRSAKPPHRRLWVPVKVQLGVRKVNLEVGLDPEDEENMEKSIIADGMLQNIGPVDISKRLFKKLRECDNARAGKLRVHDYGYDWRLSPHLLSRKLVRFLERLPSNQPGVSKEKRGALVIAHSLGGVITRHAVNQRPELFSGVLYVGAPQRCINILGPMRNGDAVAFNEKILSAQVNFSLRTSFVFLPEDGYCFVNRITKEEYPVDFYNAQDWVKYRLCPAVSEPVLPAFSRTSTFGSLLSLSDSLSSLPLRNRSGTQTKRSLPAEVSHTIFKDRTLAPQMNSSSSPTPPPPPPPTLPKHPTTHNTSTTSSTLRARNLAYLTRTRLNQTFSLRTPPQPPPPILQPLPP